MKNRKKMDDFIYMLIEDHEKDYQRKIKSKDQKSKIFLDSYYNIRNTMTLDQMRDSIKTLLVAAFDTTGTAISIVLLLLAMYQDIQDKVVEELKDIFDSPDAELTEESLSEMKYLEMVIKESLRLIPVALTIGREAKKDIALSIA